MVDIENKGTAKPSNSPTTPYFPSTQDMGALTLPLVGVYPTAESRNYPLKRTGTRQIIVKAKSSTAFSNSGLVRDASASKFLQMQGELSANAVSSKPEESCQKTPTDRNMRSFLGPLTDLLASPTPTPEMHAPQPRLLRYSDSSSSGSKAVSSNPSGPSDRHTPDSIQSFQSKLTVQLTPVKSSGNLPGEEQTIVAVRLLTVRNDADADKGRTHAQQAALQSSSGSRASTQNNSFSTGNTAIWASQPAGSVDVRATMKRNSASPKAKSSAAKFLSPKTSPMRRFSYSSQMSGLASAYSSERFHVSPLRASPHSAPFAAPPQEHAYTPWAQSPYAGPQLHAAPQQAPMVGQFSFPPPGPQQPYPEYPAMGTPGIIPGPQHESLFADYGMPSLGTQFMPGTDHAGLMEQSRYFTYDQMQSMQQAAYIQGVYAPQHVPASDDMPPGVQQPYMPPFCMQQAGEHLPPPQTMGMHWSTGPDQYMPYGMPYKPPKGRRRPVRSYMGSPPYVKGLRNPVKANTSPAQEYSQAPAQPSAEEGPDMPDKEGTGAFIPMPHPTRPTGVYVPPALRSDRNQSWHSSNPLAGKSLDQVAILCHVMASKGRVMHEVDKAAVKELVGEQIALGKPLFAPWYRDEDNFPQHGSDCRSPSRDSLNSSCNWTRYDRHRKHKPCFDGCPF